LLGELPRNRRVVRLELPRFSRAELAEQLAGLLGADPPARAHDLARAELPASRALTEHVGHDAGQRREHRRSDRREDGGKGDPRASRLSSRTATQIPPIPIAAHSIQDRSAVVARRSWRAAWSFGSDVVMVTGW
jgi:hypothetical protein